MPRDGFPGVPRKRGLPARLSGRNSPTPARMRRRPTGSRRRLTRPRRPARLQPRRSGDAPRCGGRPAVRQAQAPSATAASPGSHHPPAASPQPGAEQRAEPPRHPGAPRFAPAHAPAFPATSITQGRPYSSPGVASRTVLGAGAPDTAPACGGVPSPPWSGAAPRPVGEAACLRAVERPPQPCTAAAGGAGVRPAVFRSGVDMAAA